ncbi:MAG: transposase [Flavobacteriales bacterium]|nr:transposase [Flavobacteriales bacterium]
MCRHRPHHPAWPHRRSARAGPGAGGALSDDAAEFQITDRLSFRQFLGLEIQHKVPDAKTIWYSRECLKDAEAFDGLFDDFPERIGGAGLLLNQGKIVDATMVKAPVQRNTREENRQIKGTSNPAPGAPTRRGKGHRCTLGQQARQELLRLQEQHQGGSWQ